MVMFTFPNEVLPGIEGFDRSDEEKNEPYPFRTMDELVRDLLAEEPSPAPTASFRGCDTCSLNAKQASVHQKMVLKEAARYLKQRHPKLSQAVLAAVETLDSPSES